MPEYVFECGKCGSRFSVNQRMSEPHRAKCPKCGIEAKRVLMLAGISFKGPGFHSTDYR